MDAVVDVPGVEEADPFVVGGIGKCRDDKLPDIEAEWRCEVISNGWAFSESPRGRAIAFRKASAMMAASPARMRPSPAELACGTKAPSPPELTGLYQETR